MRSATYKVRLSRRDKILLKDIINKGVHPARQIRRAQILLDLDNLKHYTNNRKYRPTHQSIANRNGVSVTTVQAICKQYAEEGLEAVLNRKKRETPPTAPKVTGDIEARIVALACGVPPDGYSRWTLRLLENKVVELGIADSLSDTTIRRVLKKQNLSLI